MRTPVAAALFGLVALGYADDATDVLKSEEMLEELRTPLQSLSRAVMRKSLDFDPGVRTVDLKAAPGEASTILDTGAVRRLWPVGPATGNRLWQPFLKTAKRFEHFGFYNIRGAFEGERYRTLTGFNGLVRLDSGRWAHVAGRATITWKGHAVTSFETRRFQVTEFATPLFEDVLAAALPAKDYARIVHSRRDDALVTNVRLVRKETFGAIRPGLIDAHRSGTAPTDNGQTSVVDIDGDGHDDFYVTASAHTGLFFRNRGDGTFEEIGARLGLDIEGVHAVVFADFDNDGDKDAFVSHYTGGVRYLRQDNGKFAEQKDAADFLPTWVTCMSVADYNRDGLLDVYCGAYAGTYIGFIASAKEKARREGQEPDKGFPFLADDEAKELSRRLLAKKADPILRRPGPPNVLLRNVGGRFVRAKEAGVVEVYYNTMAATWNDFDRDGDMDLYVTNEAGPNQLFLNRGDGTFEDISDDTTGEYGYGMGAAWGDYDGDGDLDLYVTNMYSKAGIRIAQRHGASAAVAASARGNSLIRNLGGKFERIDESPATAADFGWGGAFADFNNDGRLDIYAPAGFVTVPAEVAQVGDT
ncbi:MAG: FG-GAP repeat domain-containing protein [Planctomycetota bacterium]|jgi:hypothetical protein